MCLLAAGNFGGVVLPYLERRKAGVSSENQLISVNLLT